MHRVEAGVGSLNGEVEAPDLEALHAEGVGLFRDLLGAGEGVEPTESRRFPVRGEDEAERFYRYLRELVDLWSAERFVPASVRFEGGAVVVDGQRLPDPPPRAAPRRLGLTRSRYLYERTADGGLRARLLFDV